MKQQQSLYSGAFILVILLSFSCRKKAENVLPGHWTREEFTATSPNGTSTGTDVHFYDFNEDGTGKHTYVGTGGFEETFNWSSDERKQVTIDGQVYEVLRSSSKKQVWTWTSGDTEFEMTLVPG